MAKRPRAEAKESYWRRKTLDQMTPSEWERLCDGCGKCCLHKLEYVDSGKIEVTNVACRLLDTDSCRCTDYRNRRRYVPDCIKLTPKRILALKWLPRTCAYRLVAEGKDLKWWHPLVSGDPDTVHRAGVSVRGRAIPEDEAGPLEQHVVDWKT